MATSGIINATDLKLYFGGTLLAECKQAALTVNMDEMAATTKDSAGWYEFLPGMRSWEVTADAWYRNDQATYEAHDFCSLIAARTSVAVTFRTSTSGDVYYTGTAYPTNWSINAGTEENTSYNISLKGTGSITQASYEP